jgi:lipopolysaccharide biosynthesis protein
MNALAFYLPQYHPIAENDEWWGKGFTEWRNVAKAQPGFKGHYQPHLPADLGYYDLRLAETRAAQAALARQYGLGGFVYYHYWFNGRRILERPFNEVLASGEPDFPFCLCWANENWTRVWDGGSRHVLLQQQYGDEDDEAHIRSLLPAFADRRYVRVDGKPLFLVYRTELLPDPARTAEIWRNIALREGVGELYLARVESFTRHVDPASIGFDAAVEFAPAGWAVGNPYATGRLGRALTAAGLLPRFFQDNVVVDYASVARAFMRRPLPPYPLHRCVTPMWDNTARRRSGARVLHGSTPALYEEWLASVVRQRRCSPRQDEALVFINAWNEWAEGNHLEPDLRSGHAYLQATQRALASVAEQPDTKQHPSAVPERHGIAEAPAATRGPAAWRRAYWQLADWAGQQARTLALLRSGRGPTA